MSTTAPTLDPTRLSPAQMLATLQAMASPPARLEHSRDAVDIDVDHADDPTRGWVPADLDWGADKEAEREYEHRMGGVSDDA